jgi:hypothetical protein
LVGKIIDGGWLDFPILPLGLRGRTYSNLMLAFSLVVMAGGLLYLGSYRSPAPALSRCGELSEC